MPKKKYDETLELQLYGLSPDLDLLDRRMTQFLGLHYTELTIESGIDRLDLNQITFSQKGSGKLNQNAITLSQKRQSLKTGGKKLYLLTKKWKLLMKLKSTNNFYRLHTFLMIG